MYFKTLDQGRHMVSFSRYIKVLTQSVATAVLFSFYFFAVMIAAKPAMAAECITISDAPLETPFSVSSVNVMFVLDDSGSMDWETLVTTDAENNPDGLFMVGNEEKYYLFDEVKEVTGAIDHQVDSDSDDSLNLYPEQSYGNEYLGEEDRVLWKSQWAGHNKMYYDPSIEYTPWYTTDNSLGNAHPDTPRFHPVYEAPTVNMSTEFCNLEDRALGDDDDAGIYSEDNGDDWYDWTVETTYDGSDRVTTDNGDGAEWEFDEPPAAGNNDIYVYVPTILNTSGTYNGLDRLVTYTITEKNTLKGTIANFNQTNNPGWTKIGTYNFNGNDNIIIRVVKTGGSYAHADAVKIVPTGGTDFVIPVAHYYVWSDIENKPYLVTLDGTIKYYAYVDDGDDKAEPDELTLTATPPADVNVGITAADYTIARQNFANWYSYYRKRWYAALNAIGKSMPYLVGKNVGFRSVNSSNSQPKLVNPVINIDAGGVNTKILLDLLYNFVFDLDNASTPLRAGLEMVGLYYHTEEVTGGLEDILRISPLENNAYASCTQNYAIIMTDGAWNGGAPLTAGADRTAGAPFADNQSGMLADVAYAYYQTDLAPDVENLVPTNFIDNNSAQHMVTYAVTFGTKGHLNPDDYSDIQLYNVNVDDRVTPPWPTPSLDFQDKIDDLYHATVNSRGKYYSSSNPKELENILKEIVQTIGSEVGSGASVSINGEEIKPDSDSRPHIFQAGYVSDGWSGDVMAFEIAQTGAVLNNAGSELWLASKVMDEAESNDLASNYWDTGRVIATYDGINGKPFRYSQLSVAQKAALDPDVDIAGDILNYLRGDHSKEMRETGGLFRNRVKMKWDDVAQAMVVEREPTTLGDIVHSAPHYVDYNSTEDEDKGILFVGANDGMLHAFKASDGVELFAYVPNLVFDNLKELVDPNYVHQYYVDMTPFTADTGTQTLLVGGLGKGGKGFYCLDITDLSDITEAVANDNNSLAETKLAAKIKWEYPNNPNVSPDNDLGYTFSRPFLVKSQAGWVIVAGNGYNSVNGKAMLYILDPADGTVLKKIDTGSGTCNGLSTTSLVDVNNDGKVDYAYAGDMNGNMWKFDLSDASVANWDVAFKTAVGAPAPLFQALDSAGKKQPITSKPDVMFHPEKSGYMVVFGTGRYLADLDFTDTSVQTIYGIWDYGDDIDDSEYLGSFTRSGASKLSNFNETDYVELLEQTQEATAVVGDNTLRIISANVPNWTTIPDDDAGQNPNPKGIDGNPANAGWYFDLPVSKERVVQRAEIRNKIAIVISYSLEADNQGDLCKPARSGSSMVHEIDAASGGRRSTPTFDINNDGKIDENDLVEIPNPVEGEPPLRFVPTGIKKPGLIYPPKILVGEKDEIKYFSSSRRTIETVREVTETIGMFYWRENRN